MMSDKMWQSVCCLVGVILFLGGLFVIGLVFYTVHHKIDVGYTAVPGLLAGVAFVMIGPYLVKLAIKNESV